MAMNRARRTSNLNNILTYDTLGNSTLIANLTVEGLTGAGFVKADAAGLLSVDTAAYTVVTGATNYLTKITGASTLGQSLVYDNGTSVLVNSTTGVPGYAHAFQVVANPSGGLVVSTTDVASAIGIVNSASANKTWDISPYGNHLVINESGVATRMKFDAGGNITIGDIVNTGHKLEVVGSFRTTGTNTLSQLQGVGDRMVVANTNGVLTTQPIPTGSITGSGAAGQVNFWTGTNTVSGSNNLFWDNAQGRLGIGTISPEEILTISASNPILRIRENTGVATSISGIRLLNSVNNQTDINLSQSNLTPLNRAKAAQLIISNNGTGGIALTATSTNANATIDFITQAFPSASASILQARITNAGNFLMGSTTDNGQRLQVYGDTLLRGSGNTSATTALTVQNSSSQNILRVLNNGELRVGNGLFLYVFPYSTVYDTLDINGSNFSIYPTQGSISLGGGSQTTTSGNANNVITKGRFFPLSGTATFTDIRCEPTINQTGGANGITRGLYVNPNLTAAADWRSIEWSNNSGWGLYGAGTANNYIAGKLLLNTTTTTNTEQLTVGGNVLLRPTGVAGTFAETSVKFYSASDSGFGAKIFTTDNSGYGIGLGISTRDGATESEKFRVFRNGNTVIQNGGTFTDLGQRLQVMGDTFVRGTGNTNTTNALAVQNSDSVNIFRVRNDATLSIGSFSENPLIYSSDFTGGVSANGPSLTFNVQNGTSGSGRYIFTGAAKSSTAASGNQNLVVYIQSFAPTSGGVSYNLLDVQPTINQTGGANGITRGIYINPALTAAADFRAIEVSSGVTVLAPSTTTSASLRLPNGVAPTTPIDGDVWSSSTDLLARIGGTTYSLINSGLSGSGAAGQVTYWDSASNITGSNNLFWDNANGRFGIGTNAPAVRTHIVYSDNTFLNGLYVQNTNTGTNSYTGIGLQDSAGSVLAGFQYVPNTFSNAALRNTVLFASTGLSKLGFVANSGGVSSTPQDIFFQTLSAKNNIYLYGSTGNLVLQNGGTFTDGGQRLQVIGDTLLRGSGATSATTALTVQDSSSTNLFIVQNHGGVGIGSTSISASSLRIGKSISGATTSFGVWQDGTVQSTVTASVFGIMNSARTQAASFTLNNYFHFYLDQYAFSGGSAVTNQYGYYADNLTGASFNYGFYGNIASGSNRWNLYMSGTADNYLAGNLGIGITPTVRLHVSGDTILRGSGATSATTALTVQNSASTDLLTVRNDGFLFNRYAAQIGTGNNVGNGVNGLTIVCYGSYTFNFNNSTGFTFPNVELTSSYLRLGGGGEKFIGNNSFSAGADLYLHAGWYSVTASYGKVRIGTAANSSTSRTLAVFDMQTMTAQISGILEAGSATSTNGSVILRGNYSNGYLTTLGTDGSSGGPMLSYGIESAQNSTAGAFVSSSGITIPRSAYVQNGGHIWYTAPSSSTAIGTAVVPTKHMELYNSGNLVLGGGADDAVNRLQVGGNVRVVGNTTTTGTKRVGQMFFGTNGQGAYLFPHAGTAAVSDQNGINLTFYNYATTTTPEGSWAFAGELINATSGVHSGIRYQKGFSPTSGTATHTAMEFVHTINQAGGATGITRAIRIIPSIVTAADFRAIEWGNNTGWGLYGVGTAKNYLNGTTLIGTTTDDGINKLQVAGSISSAGIMRADASRTAAINDVSIALLGSNITTYAAGFSMSAGGYGLNAIYAQHEQRFGGNATFDGGNLTGGGLILNKLAPTAAGTVTMTQQNSGLRVRTMSNLHLMTQFSGNNNLTVTHMSGMHIYGHYRTSGTGTLTVSTAYYGVFLADPNEFGTGATVTGSNYGFYQQGAAPFNHFGGKVIIGTTATDGTSKLRISGLPTSSAGLLTGEVWNNGGVLTIV